MSAAVAVLRIWWILVSAPLRSGGMIRYSVGLWLIVLSPLVVLVIVAGALALALELVV